jgi:dihydroxyacetone kinase-like protein
MIDAINTHEEELCRLDREIGDGDHGANLRRGFSAVEAAMGSIAMLDLADATRQVGDILTMSTGGASGPLFGTFFSELGGRLDGLPLEAALAQAVEAVMRRGRSRPGQKTMVDVLVPISEAVSAGHAPGKIKETAVKAALDTMPMVAQRGRASFLGVRSVGHEDPGARSAALLAAAICEAIEA